MLSGSCLARLPSQHPFAAFSTIGDVYSVEESADAVARRWGSLVALRAAQSGEIASPDHGATWGGADTRLLGIHGLVRHVGWRCDKSSRMRITDKGREVLGLLGLSP